MLWISRTRATRSAAACASSRVTASSSSGSTWTTTSVSGSARWIASSTRSAAACPCATAAPGARPHARLQGRPSQGGNARGDFRPRSFHDLQEPPSHAQADPLGLGDGGELVLFLGGDLHGVLEPLVKGVMFRLLRGQVPLKVVDPGLGSGPVQPTFRTSALDYPRI